MRIEVNNVYQKKSISKVKLGIVIAIFILAIGIIIWRLYYERVQTTDVSSFAEFIGISWIFEKDNEKTLNNSYIENIINNDLVNLEQENLNNKYIPNFTPESMENINNIYKIRGENQKIVYLTFDDGPSRDVTPMILDTLKEENIYATFFVLGNKVEQNPDMLLRIYEEGHYIANHGYSHIYSQVYKNKESVLEEYNKCEESIRNALQIPEYSTHLFRFPGGSVRRNI